MYYMDSLMINYKEKYSSKNIKNIAVNLLPSREGFKEDYKDESK